MLGDSRAALVEFVHPSDSPYPQEAHLALPLDSPCPLAADLALPVVFHGDLAADFPGHCIQAFRFPEVQAPFHFTGGGVLGLAPLGRAVCQVLSKEVEAA